MTEERGTYNLHRVDPDRDVDGVERIDAILHRLIDEHRWPPLPGGTPPNGNRLDAGDDLGHGDA